MVIDVQVVRIVTVASGLLLHRIAAQNGTPSSVGKTTPRIGVAQC